MKETYLAIVLREDGSTVRCKTFAEQERAKDWCLSERWEFPSGKGYTLRVLSLSAVFKVFETTPDEVKPSLSEHGAETVSCVG